MCNCVNLGPVDRDCLGPSRLWQIVTPRRTWPLDFFDRDALLSIQLMETLGHKSFSLCGWSDGGVTAMVAAAERPDLVKRLVVFGANSFISRVDLEKVDKVRDVTKWSQSMRGPMEDIYDKDYFPKLWEEWCNAYSRILEAKEGKICAQRLGAIRCPTLIVHGDKDPMLDPVHPGFLLEKIAGAR